MTVSIDLGSSCGWYRIERKVLGWYIRGLGLVYGHFYELGSYLRVFT